jgi:hypothetical protein
MIIERDRWLLGMMLMKLSDGYISIRKLCSRFSSMAQGNTKLRFFQGDKMNSTYFIECVLRPLTEICYPQGHKVGGTHERRVMLHFANAPIHNTEVAQENLADFGFRRQHPPDSPHLAPRGFFLFAAMKMASA